MYENYNDDFFENDANISQEILRAANKAACDNKYRAAQPHMNSATILKRIRDRIAKSFILDRAGLDPERVATAIIHWDAVEEEVDRIEQILETGRCCVNSQDHLLGVHGLAVEAIIDRLHKIAMNGNAVALEADHMVTFDDKLNEPKLVIAWYFAHENEAKRATRSLHREGFGVVLDDDPLFS